jgi:WD40 repeat protein
MSDGFRFGYLSGEAGSGKTSLLRAGVLNKLEGQGLSVVYVPRAGESPQSSLLQALIRKFADGIGVGDSASLREVLSAVVRAHPTQRLLVVWDQFEEFFIANPGRPAREPFLRTVGECHAAGDIPVAFLVALRKEFVEDLQDFAPGIDQPLDVRNRISIRNWDRDTAAAVLAAAAVHDHVGFADGLKGQIVEDLFSDGQIRPVELQLVATRLREEAILDLQRYRAAGGARGVLAGYVREAIAPLGAATPELQRQVTRHLLRALCAENRDTRRPTGLLLDELLGSVRDAMQASGQGGLLTDMATLNAAVLASLRRCVGAYLANVDSDNRYNLAHDYIVPSIRDATAELRTVEDQANRLLNQYVEDQARDPGVVMRFRHFLFIGRHASPALKGKEAAVRLLRRTRRSVAFWATGFLLVPALVLTLLLPPHTALVSQTEDVEQPEWVLSKDRRLAVAITRRSKAEIWKTDEPWSSRQELPFPFDDVIISPKSQFVAGRSSEGNVYVWRSQDKLTSKHQPAVTGLPKGKPLDNPWAGFSSDEKWIFVVSGDGKLYLWNPAEPHPNTSSPFLTLKADLFDNNWAPPLVLFSPDAQWIAASDAPPRDARLYLLRTKDKPAEKLQPLLESGGGWKTVFSLDSQWVAASSNSGVYVWPLLSDQPQQPERVPDNVTEGMSVTDLRFSPNGNWLVLRTSGRILYAWKVTKPPVGQGKGLQILTFKDDTRTGFVRVSFSPNDEWAAGITTEQAVYVWSLADFPGQVPSPSFPGRERDPVDPRFTGITKDYNLFIKFSPQGNYLLGRSVQGNVFAWKVESQPDLSNPIAYSTARTVTPIFTTDGRSVFLLGGNSLEWGDLGEPLREVLRADYEIQDIAITSGGDKLLVLGVRHLTVVRRRFYFWGLPLWDRSWPAVGDRQ